tara:strand:+ start:2601 stop:3371 length:771 start_codon:yes stop_codon:yes gene_type:complete
MKPLFKDPISDFGNLAPRIRELIRDREPLESCLLYNAALETSLANYGHSITSHTLQYVVYEFWTCLLHDGKRIYDILHSDSFQFDTPLIPIVQQDWPTYSDPFVRAAFFYALARGSDVGRPSRGTINIDEFNHTASRRLTNFNVPNFKVEWNQQDNLNKTLQLNEPTKPTLLIPAGKYSYNLNDYGKNRGPEDTIFNHKELAAELLSAKRRWILLYKNHPHVVKTYQRSSRIIPVDMHGNITHKKKDCAEVIIANF